MRKFNNSFLKISVVAMAVSALTMGTVANAAMVDAESSSTPTIKGYAPYLQSVGSRFVGKEKGEVFIGDIIEVPTDAFTTDTDFYTYRDGNATTLDGVAPPQGLPAYLQSQDLDKDNSSRVRPGQFLKQKVSVKWYIVEANNNKKWADQIFAEANPTLDFYKDFSADVLTTPAYDNAVKSWADVTATALEEETYYVPMGNGSRKSLALRVPPEAANKRIGFIIVPESQTGDPFRGNPLKVPDLNFFWKQDPVTEPGDVCDLTPEDDLSTSTACNTNPGEPTTENPGNGGGFVQIRQYMINIRWSKDGTGVPTFDEAGRPIDPIVGTSAAPFPYTNSVYYPEISILTKQGDDSIDPNTPSAFSLPITAGDFRLLKDDEKETITWQLTALDLDEDPTSANFGQYIPETEHTATLSWADDKTSNRFINLKCDAAVITAMNSGTSAVEALGGIDANGKPSIACNPYSDHAFRTQLNEPEAISFWNGVNSPFDIAALQEKSEQRMAIKVKFSYDNGQLDTSNTQIPPVTP